MQASLLEIFSEHHRVIKDLESLAPDILAVSHKMIASLQKGGKIFWMGNGGSAADAQHMAAELVGRFKKERKALASIALTTDTSILTSVSNDYGFNTIFSRQLEGLCASQDIIIALSTSGNSPNIIAGIEIAKKIGAFTVGLTGQTGGALKSLVDVCLCVPSQNTPRIQEAHSLIGHILCEKVDEAF